MPDVLFPSEPYLEAYFDPKKNEAIHTICSACRFLFCVDTPAGRDMFVRRSRYIIHWTDRAKKCKLVTLKT